MRGPQVQRLGSIVYRVGECVYIALVYCVTGVQSPTMQRLEVYELQRVELPDACPEQRIHTYIAVASTRTIAL